jgi:hypothetical protein
MKAEGGREGSCGRSAAWVGGLGFPQAKGEILRRIQSKFLIGLLGFLKRKQKSYKGFKVSVWSGFLAFLKRKEKSYEGFKVSVWSVFLAFLKRKEESYEGFKVSFWSGFLAFLKRKEILLRIQCKFLIRLLGFPQAKGEILRKIQGQLQVYVCSFKGSFIVPKKH